MPNSTMGKKRETMTSAHAPVTCGVPEHESDCLCDVVLEGDPTPINFGLTELWHGAAVAQALDLGVPWDGGAVADFGSALLKAYDIFTKLGRGQSHDLTTLAEQAKGLLRTGTSMVDVSRQLDCTHSMVMQALTNNVPSVCWEWRESDWLDMEDVVYNHFPSLSERQAAAVVCGGDPSGKSGAARRLAANLADWYGVRLGQNAQERLDAMKAALLDGLHPIDATALVASYGFEVTLPQMRMARRRLVASGECCAELPPRV